MTLRTKILSATTFLFLTFGVIGILNVSASIYDQGAAVAASGDAYSGFTDANSDPFAGKASPNIFVSVTPPNPKPGDIVSIKLSSDFTDLNQADIVWTENGNVTNSGTGKTSYTVTAGKIGDIVKISAAVKTIEGSLYEYPITIKPATVDIVWESDSTVPPFYKGKALYTQLGRLKLIAIPNIDTGSGTNVNPSNLVYTWKRQGQVIGDRSGLGKQTIDMSNDNIYRTPFTVDVVAASADGTYVAEGNINIDTVTPLVEIYENNPIYGILYNKTVGSQTSVSSGELTFDAFPYYFSAANRFDSQLIYAWNLNYQSVSGQSGPSLSLKNDKGQTGAADLFLQVTNQTKFFESGAAEININLRGN